MEAVAVYLEVASALQPCAQRTWYIGFGFVEVRGLCYSAHQVDRALFGGSPVERPEFYRERSPITYADRVAVPVLVTVGRNDPRCPRRQIENYVTRLRELDKPHEVYEFDAGHSSMVVDEQIRQMEIQLAFCHRHLDTPAPTVS